MKEKRDHHSPFPKLITSWPFLFPEVTSSVATRHRDLPLNPCHSHCLLWRLKQIFLIDFHSASASRHNAECYSIHSCTHWQQSSQQPTKAEQGDSFQIHALGLADSEPVPGQAQAQNLSQLCCKQYSSMAPEAAHNPGASSLYFVVWSCS